MTDLVIWDSSFVKRQRCDSTERFASHVSRKTVKKNRLYLAHWHVVVSVCEW